VGRAAAAAGLREVNLALAASNGAWLGDDEQNADASVPGDGVGGTSTESPLSRNVQESGTMMKT
jgi:hypothetical protein